MGSPGAVFFHNIGNIIHSLLGYSEILVKSDFFLLTRVLTNMIVNALEATDREVAVKIWVDPDDRSLSFFDWNHQAIDKSVVGRIFQRSVSTKADSGRGMGTYSMKLFDEKYLNGKIH